MKTNTCSVIFATLLALAIPQYIEAHGYMKQVTIDGGTPYSGIKPESTAINKSPIRAITDQSPIKDPNSKEMACGKGARNTLVVATAKPGSKITIAVGYTLVIVQVFVILIRVFSGAIMSLQTTTGSTILGH
jgi:hypothetical protein